MTDNFLIEDGDLIRYTQKIQETDVVIPDSVMEIKAGAFKDCFWIRSVIVPEGVMMIGEEAFAGCKNLRRIYLPDSLKFIDTAAFEDCIRLQSITLPKSIDVISERTFSGCTALEDVQFSYGVEYIDTAFEDCTSLRRIKIPATLRLMADAHEVFRGCTALESVVFVYPDSDNVSRKPLPENYCTYDGALYSLGNGERELIFVPPAKQRINMHKDTDKIGEKTFENSKVASLFIPASVREIKADLSTASELRSITVDADNTFYSSFDDILYTKDGDRILRCPPGKSKVKLADTAGFISEKAFENCCKLTGIDLANVRHIEANAFSGCCALKNIAFSASLSSIEEYCFTDTAWFKEQRQKNPLVSVGDILIDAGTALGNVRVPDGIKTISPYAFANNKGILSVTHPSSLKRICKCAFLNCRNLTSIAICSVVSIEDNAFEGCGIETLDLPLNTDNLDPMCFSGAKRLKAINISPNNKRFCSVDGMVFSKNMKTLRFCPNNKTEVIIPEGTQDVSRFALYENDSLKRLTLPKSLHMKSESEQAFIKALSLGVDLDDVAIFCTKDTSANEYLEQEDIIYQLV